MFSVLAIMEKLNYHATLFGNPELQYQ